MADSTAHKQPRANGAYTNVDALLRLRFVASDLTLENRKKSRAAGDGDSRTHFRGRGMEFSEVRLYQPGDDIRNIDWRVTARTTQTYTKLFQEERERQVYLVVDQRSPMFFGSQQLFKSVYAAQIAAIAAWIAAQNNDRIGALLFSDNDQKDLRARRGKHALLAFLNQLQEYNQRLRSPIAKTRMPTADIFEDVRRVAKPGSAVFIISDFHDFDEHCVKPLIQLARHTDVSLFHVYDPLEQRLPEARLLTLSDGSHRLSVDTAAGNFNAAFQNAFEQRRKLVARACINTASRFVNAPVHIPAADLMRDIFLAKGRNRNSRRQPA